MKIVLINPPSPFLINQKALLPLGLLYLSSALKKNGYDVEVLDLAEKENEIESLLMKSVADLYGITATTPQYSWAKQIKNILNKKDKDVKIMIGGTHASGIPNICYDDGFDITIVGEGEAIILDVINRLEEGKLSFASIEKAALITNIDTIARPDRDAININEYGYDINGYGKATSLITSRGCPYHCIFCSKGVWGDKVRYHSVEYVIAEIKEIKEKYKFNCVQFLDDSFILNMDRAEKMLKEIQKLKIFWRCYIRSDRVTKELLRLMKDAGCIEVGIGVESASQKILDIIRKGEKIEQHTQVVSWCKELGILVNVFLMIGLPGETYETVMETKRWFEKVLPDKFGFNIFYPYVGCEVSRDPFSFDLKVIPHSESDSWVKGRKGEYKALVSTKDLSSEEILSLHQELFECFINLTGWRQDWGKK